MKASLICLSKAVEPDFPSGKVGIIILIVLQSIIHNGYGFFQHQVNYERDDDEICLLLDQYA